MSNLSAASRFDEIYNNTRGALLALITAKCKRIDDVGDIFQDTYMELYRVLLKRGVGYVTNEKALVIRIAKRKIAKYYSLVERSRIFVSMTPVNEDGVEFNVSGIDLDAFLTEDFTINKILLETARDRINQKPEDIQKVFHLYYYIGLTIPEIAKELGLSESNVKHKLYRTLEELRNLLK